MEAKLLADRSQLTDLEMPGNIPSMDIYYGSQTGTAEKFAGVIEEEATML